MVGLHLVRSLTGTPVRGMNLLKRIAGKFQ
jgi:hypothetical protein